MNDANPEHRFEELDGDLRPLVEAVCQSPPPRRDCERVLNLIAAWEPPIAAATRPSSALTRWAMAAVCLTALLATAANLYLVLRFESRGPQSVQARNPADRRSGVQTTREERDAGSTQPATVAGAPLTMIREPSPRETSPGQAEAISSDNRLEPAPYAISSPWGGVTPALYSRNVLVSGDGNVIAARGPQFPLSLGDVVPATVPDAAVQLWRWRDGARSRLIAENAANCLAISRDGRMLATPGQLWDAEAGQPVRSFDFDAVAAEFSPSAELLAAVAGGPARPRINLLDIDTGGTLQEIAAPKLTELSLAFTPDGEQLLVAGESTIQRWNVSDRKLAGEFRFGDLRDWGPEQATGSPNTPVAGDMVTAWASLTPDSLDEWLDLWYAEPLVPRSIEVYESYNAGAVQRVVMFDDDGREIELWKNPEVGPVVHAAPRVLAFEVSAEAPVSRIRLHLASTQVPGWNEIDAVALVDESGKRHWADRAAASSTYADRDAGRYTPRPVMLAVSPQGKQLVTSGQATQLWDLETGRLLHRLEPRASNDNYPFYPHRSAGYAIAFSPDGGSIAVGTPYNVVLFDAATGQEIRQLPATTAGAAFLRFASDGRTLTLINNTFLMRSHPNGPDAWVCPSVQVWDVAEPRLLQTVP